MNDEIKEILYLEKYIDKYKSDEKSIINGNRLTTPAMLDYLEVKALLNYITNLEKENERLKLELSGYREAILRDDKLLGLQQRIDKAVKYIKSDDYWVSQVKANETLLNILNGKEGG